MPNGAQDRRSRADDPSPGDALGLADALREQTQGYVEKRKADAARVVSDVADAIRGGGAGFDGYPQVKAFFDQAALGVDELAEDIARRSFGELYDEVRAAVRRRPAVAAAAAALAGFALFRIVSTPQGPPVPRARAMVPVDVSKTPNV